MAFALIKFVRCTHLNAAEELLWPNKGCVAALTSKVCSGSLNLDLVSGAGFLLLYAEPVLHSAVWNKEYCATLWGF